MGTRNIYKTLEKQYGILIERSKDLKSAKLSMSGFVYVINSDGSIFREGKKIPLIRIKGWKTKNGYMMFKAGGSSGVDLYIHRVVAECFVDNCFNKGTVNHLDGDKENNSASNLEWATYSENHLHAYNSLGRVPGMKGKRKGNWHFFDKSRGVWRVSMYTPTGNIYGGSFTSEELAIAKAQMMEKELRAGDKGDAAQDLAKAKKYREFREAK